MEIMLGIIVCQAESQHLINSYWGLTMRKKVDKYNVIELGRERWKLFRKKILTRAFQADFDFEIHTREGIVYGQKGDWIALDNEGNPYPIADEIMKAMYEEYRDLKDYRPQTCKYCGREQHIVWKVSDELWEQVMGKDNQQTVCLECFAAAAAAKNITIKPEQVTILAYI